MRIQIARIKVQFYIRVALEQERVDFFHQLMLNSVEFKPIVVMKGDFPEEYVLIDGRHRIMASQDLGEDDIEADILDKMPIENAYALALKMNYGDSLPPTEEDFIHFADMLIKLKMSREKVVNAMGVLPARIAAKFYDIAKERIVHRMVLKAMDIMANSNLNREEAIKKVNDGSTVKINVKQIEAENLKRSKSRQAYGPRYERMMSDMGKRFRVFNKLNSEMFKKLQEGYGRNEVEPKKVKEILGHFAQLVGNTVRMISDWEKRFELKAMDKHEEAPFFGTRVTTRRERRHHVKQAGAAA